MRKTKLKPTGNNPLPAFLPEQQILNLIQPPILLVGHMIPCTRIAIKHRRSFDDLPPILASLAFESVMRIAVSIGLEVEQLLQPVQAEISFYVFDAVDDGRGERLFVRLALEDFLFDSPRDNEVVDETVLFLPATPDSR